MKLTEIDRLTLQNLFLKSQILINQSPYYGEIIKYKTQEMEEAKKILEKLNLDITKVTVDYETGEVSEVKNAVQ